MPQIPPVAGCRFNICLTNLTRPPIPFWNRQLLQADQWSRLLESGKLGLVKQEAAKIYRGMDETGYFMPVVTQFEGSIKMEYTHGDYIAVFLLDPSQTRFGSGKRGEPYALYTVDVDQILGA